MKLNALVSAIIALGFSSAANAELDIFDLSLSALTQVEVATETPVSIIEAPSIVSVITKEDIELMAANTLPDILKTLPGFNITSSTLNRMNPVFSIRGIYTGNSAQVLFLLNGNRIQGSLYSMGLDKLSHWPIHNIQRVEVIRGPGSALYGADAFAGVVNIITLTDEQNDNRIGAKFGSNQTHNVWSNFSHTFENQHRISGYVEYFKQENDTDRVVTQDLQTTLDGGFGTRASVAPTYLSDQLDTIVYGMDYQAGNWYASLNGYNTRNKGIGAGAAQALDNLGGDDYDMIIAEVSYQEQLAKDILFNTKFNHYVSHTNAHFYIFPPGSLIPFGNDGNLLQPHDGEGCQTVVFPGLGCLTQFTDGVRGNPGSTDKSSSIDMSFTLNKWQNHQVRTSFGFKSETFDATEQKNFGPGVLDKTTVDGVNPIVVDGNLTDVAGTEYVYTDSTSRDIKHLLIQDIWQLDPNWTLTSGLRYDHYSDFGSTFNPRVSLVWQTSKALTVKLLYGTAYRAPSVGELYAKNNPIQLGNTELKPEEIETWEVSFTHQYSDALVQQLNFYQFHASDLIDYVINPQNALNVAQNTGRLDGKGLEYQLSYLPSANTKLVANYSYQSTKNKDDHQQAYVPKHKVDVTFNWLLNDKLALHTQWLYAKDIGRDLTDPREPISNINTLDLAALYKINASFNLKIGAMNSLDKQYVEPSSGVISGDYPAYDRRVYASISYQWN